MVRQIKIGVLICFVLIAGLFISCESDGSGLEVGRNNLVEHDLRHTWSSAILGFFVADNILVSADSMKYDVAIYDVQYTTEYKGEMVVASGRIFVPKTEDEVSTVVFSHGTIASDAEAMTNISPQSGQSILMSGLASMGYVVVAPDLIGFGASSGYTHPYYVEEPTATATIDNIYASWLLANELELNIDRKLFLTGYSQGGYSTMCTHKSIEQNGIEYYDLVASFPSSGGYDLLGVQDYFFSQSSYHQPFYLAYVAISYFNHYEWYDTYSLDMIFKEPFASRIPDLIDGSLEGSQINEQLTDSLALMINDNFLENPNGSQYSFLTDAYVENSPIDWVPTIPMYMCHGAADTTISFSNSENVFHQFINQGASQDVVTLTSFEGADHAGGVLPYVQFAIKNIIEYEN